MTRSVSEISLMSNAPQIPIENSQIVLHDEDENSNVLDVSEYCSNREVVNLENANVNVDNSTDVIFGPVTQFNVNGNVTIYSNGSNSPSEAVNRTIINQEERQASPEYADDFKSDKSVAYCFQILYYNGDLIRNLTIILVICVICFTVSLIMIQNLNYKVDDYNYNYTEPCFGDHLGKHIIFYREDWGGKPPKINTAPLEHPISLIIISHTTTFTCNSNKTCSSLVREIQMKHFAPPIRSVDIGYNFLIGGDGNIYVGRGWEIQNYHHRKNSIGISFIGNFNFDDITMDMMDAVKELIKQGRELKKIVNNYILIGENQTTPKAYTSPGVNVYEVIKKWPHFSNEIMF